MQHKNIVLCFLLMLFFTLHNAKAEFDNSAQSLHKDQNESACCLMQMGGNYRHAQGGLNQDDQKAIEW